MKVSAAHMVFTINGEAVPAGSLKKGDKLVGENDKVIRVRSVTTETLKGFIAPLTASGTILVEGVVSSNYVDPDYSKFSIPGKSFHPVAHIGTAAMRWFSWAERHRETIGSYVQQWTPFS